MSGLSQAGAGVGGLVGLSATSSPSDPFGSTKKTSNFLANTVTPIDAGGLKVYFNSGDNAFKTDASPYRQGLVNALSNVYGNTAGEIGGLRAQVTPGYGRLTDAVVTALNNTRDRTISNLTDELGRRRMLGSSFGADTIARAEKSLGDTEAQYRANAFLSELSANVDLLNQQTQNLVAEQTTRLNELNLQADLAYKLGTGLNEGIQKAAVASQQMLMQDQMDRNAALISSLSNVFGGLVGTGTSQVIGSSSSYTPLTYGSQSASVGTAGQTGSSYGFGSSIGLNSLLSAGASA